MPLYDFECTNVDCAYVEKDALLRNHATSKQCPYCSSEMRRLDPLVAQAVFGPGRSAESKAAWGAQQKAVLTKRSLDYDRSPAGQQARGEQIEKLRRNGTIPSGWSA